MLPSFLKINGEEAGPPVQVPAPPHFRAIVLPVKEAALGNWTRSSTGVSAAQKSGLRYEKKIHIALRERYGFMYHESQAIHYVDNSGGGTCIPDGIIKLPTCIVVVEVKSQHMPESWWQLRKKYEPIVRAVWPGEDILLLEICRSLDIDMPYPEKFTIVEDLDKWTLDASDGSLGVLKWKL